jgi:hypothetical protein
VPSPKNGLPRNTFVPGYTKGNGTKVKPHTKSSPRRKGK